MSDASTILGHDQPWPLRDVLARLCDAAEHLRDDHQCDRHGYEEDAEAVRRGREIIARIDSIAFADLKAGAEELLGRPLEHPSAGFYSLQGNEETAPDGSVIVHMEGTRYRILPAPDATYIEVERWVDKARIRVTLREYVELGFHRWRPMYPEAFVHTFRKKWEDLAE